MAERTTSVQVFSYLAVKGIGVDKMNCDLLVVVLAILTDAVPQSAVAEALRSWTSQPGQSLTQWLKKSAGLSDARIRGLECLAAAHLKAHQNDLRLSLNAWNAFELTQDVLTEINDDALRTTLGASLGGGSTLPLVEGTPENSLAWVLNQHLPTPEGERFQLIRPHAQGGIGQVWVARDSELQRDVALKEIQPRFAERPDHRARFVLEAEITGNLEHPGIVPVYSLGRNADGRPYYAMRFIQGESFSVAIRRFHKARREQADGAKTGLRPSWGIEFRQLLRRFLDVCDAIDYAHSRGVLHRDLKPANIMLGRYGETLVVDWGLAKVIGKNDVIPVHEDGLSEPGFTGSSVASSDETLQGTTIGTPSYMSPEQARGDINQLGPRSDVFSLGATLYELLTGELPFTGKRVHEIIEKVMKGDVQRPRVLDRTLPAPLDAVCMKALAGEPEERYASVRALAQDLEHWLADEPVTAYPEQSLERLGRWLRQHRTWTAAAAAALVGVSLAAIIGVVVVDQARRREEQARRREEVVRKEAENNFNMAQAAVDDYLTSVSENTLLQQQDSADLRSLRRELLNNALSYYKKFVNQRGDDPLLQRQLANAYFRVGGITREIDSVSDAITAFRSAQKIWESMTAAEPYNHELRGRLADCHLAIGKLLTSTGDLQGAMTSLNQARDLLTPLRKDHPDVSSYTTSLADCYLRIGIVQSDLKSIDQALAALEQAKSLQEEVTTRAPGRAAGQQMLAEISIAMGILFYERKDNPAALRSFQDVTRICELLVDNITVGPKPERLIDLLAVSHYDSGAIHRDAGRPDEAMKSFERSLGYRTSLADAHPSVTVHQEHLGKTLAELALLHHDLHEDDKALTSIQKSIDILERLVKSQPDQPVYRHDLGRSWNIRGFIHDDARENVAAAREFERAITEERRAVAAAPDLDLYRDELSNQLDNLGEQYVDMGKVSDALPHYREEIKILGKLCDARPDNDWNAQKLATALTKFGNIQRHNGDSVSAADTFKEAQQALERVGAGNAAHQGYLGALLTQRAVALADQGNWKDALPLAEQAVHKLSQLGPVAATDDRARASLSDSLWELARIARGAGETAKAADSDAKREALWKEQPPAKLATLALETAKQALLIGYGKTPISEPARSVRELDLERAAADLRLANKLGFTDVPMLRKHRESWALGALLERVEIKPPGKGPDLPSATGPGQTHKEP
jgi:eukaryotic-like serine/threonine-protein kinase